MQIKDKFKNCDMNGESNVHGAKRILKQLGIYLPQKFELGWEQEH